MRRTTNRSSGGIVVGLVLAALLAVVVPIAAERPQDPPPGAPCAATADNPIAICFPERPLTIDHCAPAVEPHFEVDVWDPPDGPPVGFRYSYQVRVDGKDGQMVTFPTPPSQAFPYIGNVRLERPKQPYAGRSRYALQVTVATENQKTFTSTSREFVLEDKPRVGGLAVGISTYSNTNYNLNYPAEDARAFHATLTKLLSVDANVNIELRTTANVTDENKNALSKTALLRSIDAVAELSPDATPEEAERWNNSRLCGPQDWYVFYYSGHGIVSANPNLAGVSRYLSTPFFHPRQLKSTSIWLPELATSLFGTSVRNILIVLDSCFSGTHRHDVPGQPATGRGRSAGDVTTAAVAHTAKVKWVADGEVKEDPIVGTGDADVFADWLRRYAGSNGRAVVLAATSADREAEEGPVSYQNKNGQYMLEFQRSSVSSNQKKPGYGLFTYTWLANLLAQLPEGTDVSGYLANGRPPIGKNCSLRFDTAGNDAVSDINRLATSRGWSDLQVPEVRLELVPPALPCSIGED